MSGISEHWVTLVNLHLPCRVSIAAGKLPQFCQQRVQLVVAPRRSLLSFELPDLGRHFLHASCTRCGLVCACSFCRRDVAGSGIRVGTRRANSTLHIFRLKVTTAVKMLLLPLAHAHRLSHRCSKSL